MQLDMALGSAAPTSFQHRCGVTAALILVVCVALTKSGEYPHLVRFIYKYVFNTAPVLCV